MSISYQAKDTLVLGRQLKVQRLVIPFVITGNATPASVSLTNDEPSVMFIQSQGVNQISAALASGETATFSASPNDASGIFNILVRINEQGLKVCSAKVISRTAGTLQPCYLGSATGLSSLGNLMLTCDSTVDLSAANLDACLEVDYVVAE